MSAADGRFERAHRRFLGLHRALPRVEGAGDRSR
jgi:hypothetical protein